MTMRRACAELGAPPHEHLSSGEVTPGHREMERRVFVVCKRVHRGAVLEERLDDLTMAESRREMKGRATIGSGRVDRAAARRPAFEERNERSRVPLSSRLVERRERPEKDQRASSTTIASQ